MDATQMISDSILESDEEENEEENRTKRGRPLAKLCILKNEHIPETELPLFLGENVLGRDPNTCTLPLPAPSISKRHAKICISVYRRKGRHGEADTEALVWDLGSMNGTRKGRLKLTPNVRYALSECDSLVVADIPCQYVSCAADTAFSQGDFKTPVSRNSGVKARLPDASGEKGGDTNTDSKTRVNGGTKARVSIPDVEDRRKSPVGSRGLSFEQTPTQPQGTLVPESDSDSDGERGRGAERRRKALVSHSDSYKSSPSCSTFLTPTNKIVPESEDEGPITPSTSAINRPHRHVNFSKEETDVDVGRQQPKEKKAIVDDSEEGEGMEGERAARGVRPSEESGQHVPVEQESNVSLTGEDELPVSTPAVLTGAIPAFNMDSDTDVEGEEDGAPAGPVTLNTNPHTDQPPDTAQFHMDSDTDVDEDDDALGKVPKSVPSSADNTKPPPVISVIQPEAFTMDSDTDVDDDDAAVSDAASKAKPVSFQSTDAADSAPSTQPKDFHLDSDTDVDEEEEEECGTINKCSEIDQIPTRLDIEPTGPESAAAAPHSLHLDSDTDDEAIAAPAISEPSVVSAVTASCTAAVAGADLDVLSDSDTDVEDDSPLVIPFVATTLSFAPDAASEALQSDSDAGTDVDESCTPPAGDGVNPADHGMDSDTDVEDKEVDFGGPGEGQIPSLDRENTNEFLVPALQNCSTPVQLPEGEAKDMDTQDFQSPSSGPFRRALAPALRPKVLSPSSDSQEDEDFVVAETQSFILQTRDCGGNPPEDHLHGQAQALAMESTQAFASVEAGVNLEATQAYAAISNADRASLENDSNLEATQAYGEDEEPAGCSPTYEKEDQVDLALEATQAYIPEPSSDSEDETHEDERKDMTTAETQPLDFPTSSTLAIAETQPMSVFEEEERLDEENLVSSVLHVKRRPQNETGEREEQGEAAQPQAVAETQPMHASDHEESDEEGLIAGPRKRKAKPLQPGEEPAQRLTSSLGETQPMHIGVDETQPMAMSGNDESDEEDVIQGPRKRKAKPLQLEEEQTQMFTNSELSAVETQPVDSGECEESDEEDSFPGPRKRKAKPLQLEEEQTQSLTSSEVPAAETQPMGTCEGAQSDEEDSIPGPRKRKAKPLQIQEEESQTITNSEASTVETQPLETQTGPQPQRGKGAQSEAGTSGITVRGKRGTRARSREEDEQEECSDPPKRQMRGKSKALPTTRGRRGTPRPDEDESEKEEKVEQAMRPRGKKSTREQKIDGEEGERNKNAENESLIKEQEEGTLGEEKDVTKLGQQMEKERRETNGRERKQEEGQHSREEQETLERERKEKEEQERLQAENAKRLRLEQERAEKETTERQRKEREEKERADKTQKKKEQLEREIKEREEKERVECEKAEREEKERLEREKIEKERKQQEEKERLETAKRELKERLEREEQERQARLETEAKEREQRERLEKEKQEKEAKEKQIKEQQENKEEENEPKAPARGRRAARRTTAAPKPEPDPTNDDVPARRTRSRSNSSNSVNSERSASSVDTQQSGGRGRGRGAKRTSEPPRAATARSSTRRRTVAAEPTDQDRSETAPQGGLSRSNSNNSLNSEISSCSLSSQSRGRGGRQRGRGRKTEADSIPPFTSQSDQNSAPKATTRGRRSVKAEGSSNVVSHEDDIEKADSQQASTTRGRRRANGNASEPAGAGEEDPSNQEEGCANEEPLPPKRNVRGRGQKAVKSETVEAAVAPAVSDGDQAKDKRTGRKRESEANAEEDSSSSSKISKGKEKTQTAQAADGEAKGETKGNTAVQANRRGRASTAQAKKNAKEEEESEKMEEEAVDRRGRGRSSAIQKKRKEEQEDSGTSVDQDTHVEASEPQTPTSRASRKRQAPPDSSPVAKTPRSSSASPAASGRFRAASQACKVLFTGVMDEAGERVLARLGGSMAKGVADMNFLVTDKVRRTVKFLCAVAKGVPIVTTHWLEKSGKAGSFLSPNAFAVKDPEQEKKFNFCLQESLRIASSQLLLKGYEIHVTKSVKPEPVQMKDIITCSGATFLAKMPSSHKPQTVVISCEEDWSLCRPALSASVPVVTAEFILTGILQQKLDFQTHSLPAPASHLQPAGGRGRGKKKS
ncbi:mediator of DNA damage checkpoint protein 1 isoform X2 [Chaetodon trifascialis]|uniref:mediator of DNA damage checkpoint protein 1 isoform X2 n=1 Tax=Chaetodon trifascialis TaxID=109706 RepID=UPI0039931057